jgi:predicted ATPase/serine/threonine protein kinase
MDLSPERWQKVKEIVADTVALPLDRRDAYVQAICADDLQLRADVDTVLNSPDFLSSAFHQTTSLIGHLIGPYRITGVLGAGGMGRVFTAFDMSLRRTVALKILHPRAVGFGISSEQLLREARAVAQLEHPNIVRVYHVVETENANYIVMEYLQGETLADTLKRERKLDPLRVIAIGLDIVEAIAHAHDRNLLHCDLKPANVFLTKDRVIKVMDFGIARQLAAMNTSYAEVGASASLAARRPGTPAYMSPEQLRGMPLDVRSDIYSLGVLLCELVTGRKAFELSTALAVEGSRDPNIITASSGSIPRPLWLALTRAIQHDRDKRYTSAKALGDALKIARRQLGRPRKIRSAASAGLRTANTLPATAGRGRSSMNNLPQQLTRFIGRQRDIADVRGLLRRARLVTLAGPGGIGKTRLALQVAGELEQQYHDGVCFVEFASLSDDRLVPHTVASTLGVTEERGRTVTATLAEHVKGRTLLLVLDNCEHLISACAQLAENVLRTAPNVRVLATSREPLGINGETVFRVPSLGVPDPEGPGDADNLCEHDAVELFVDRARAVKPTFAITPPLVAPLARLCVRLEGIPLAIELAASRVKVLSVAQIADRLDNRFKLLTAGSRTALPRHQTLLAAIDWSYNLLTEAEKILFRRLSVFAGGWTLDAGERVCAGNGVEESSVLELLSGLVDKSLVLTEDRDGNQRYRFMVTLLDYAHERLMETDEHEQMSSRYAAFFNEVAAEGEPNLTGADQRIWLQRLSAEFDNFRAVLSWTSTHDVNMALELAGALGRFWYIRGHLDEGRRWLTQVLAASAADSHIANRAKALNAAARLAQNQGDYTAARSMSEQALTQSRQAGDRRETAGALHQLAVLEAFNGDFARARSLVEESLSMWRELGDKARIGLALDTLGALAFRQADSASADRYMEQALHLAIEVGNTHGIAQAMVNCGEVARRRGAHARAHELLQRAVIIAREVEDNAVIPMALGRLGELAARLGNYASAHVQLHEALRLARELGDKRPQAYALRSLGIVAEACSEYAEAEGMFQQSVVIWRELGDRLEFAAGLNCVGRLAARRGDLAQAQSDHEAARTISEQIGAKDGLAASLSGLAALARRRGDDARALSLYEQSLSLWFGLGETPELPQALENLAAVDAARGEHERAVRLWGAAEALRTAIGLPRAPNQCDEFEHQISASRAALGDEPFVAAWRRGEAMNVNEAAEYALGRSGGASDAR